MNLDKILNILKILVIVSLIIVGVYNAIEPLPDTIYNLMIYLFLVGVGIELFQRSKRKKSSE